MKKQPSNTETRNAYDRAMHHVSTLTGVVGAIEECLTESSTHCTDDDGRSSAKNDTFDLFVEAGLIQSQAESLFRLLEVNPPLFRKSKRSGLDDVWQLRLKWINLIDRLDKARRKLKTISRQPVQAASTQGLANEGVREVNSPALIRAASLFAEVAKHFSTRPRLDVAPIDRAVAKSHCERTDAEIANAIATIEESQLFDEAYYLSQLSEIPDTSITPIEHYLRFGSIHGIDPNPLFSVDFYRNQGATVEGDPLVHYIRKGSAEMRDPHPLFLTRYYSRQLGVEKSTTTWLGSFLSAPERNSRSTPIFDVKYYIATAGLGEVGFVAALVHYLVIGWRNGYAPTPLFDTNFYLSQVEPKSARHPFLHFALTGWRLGASPHRFFSIGHYTSQFHESQKLDYDPLTHYLLEGERIGLQPSRFFDPAFYRGAYYPPGTPLDGALADYITVGSSKDHDPSAIFNASAYRKMFMHNSDSSSGMGALEHLLYEGLRIVSPENLTLLPVETAEHLSKSDPQRTRIEIPQVLISRTKYRETKGDQPYKPGRPSILLVGHAAADHLFGSERSFLDMLDGLSALDVNVVVVLPRDVPTYTSEVKKKSTCVATFSYGWWRKSEMTSPDALAMFSQIIQSRRIDVVYCNTIMLRECLDAARAQYVPSVVHVRELITGDEALANIIGEAPDKIVSSVLNRADWIVANSESTAEVFYKPGCTFVVPNTLDVQKFSMSNLVRDGIVRFGLISSNIPKKGLDDVVQLARLSEAACPRARFIIIGPNTDSIKRLIDLQKSGDVPGNLEFPGYSESPQAAIAQVNVVLSLSHFAESFGRTALEAMAAGRPVIAYKFGALPELVRHGVNGFLVPYKQIHEALPFVEQLCNDVGIIETMGESGRSIASERYGIAAYRTTMKRAFDVILPEAMAPKDNCAIETPSGPIIRPARLPSIKSVAPVLKIAYFCWHFPVPSETFVLNELRELISRGVDVIVFCKQIPYKDFDPGFKIRFERISSPADLAKRLRETGRTVVHAHFVYPTVTEMVWPACEEAGIPFTFIAHAQDIFKYDNDRRNRIADIGASPLCVGLFTLSRYHMDFLTSRGFPRRKILINPNAVDATRFEAAQVAARAERPFRRIVAVHRYVPKKGLELLIKAAALLSDLKITIDIFGYGELADEYHRTVSELGLENVRIHGPISQAEVVEVMREADLFACPAVRVASTGDMDGLPTSIVEGMTAGVPILTTSVGALPELVIDGVTGIVADPNVEDIAAAIRRFYAMPTAQVEAIIAAAKDLAVERHDVRKLATVLLRVWENRTIDIIVVSWNNLTELRAVVDHILDNTSLPFHLIICDNKSSREPVPQYLDALWRREDRVTIIHNDSNAMVGPGTNAALAEGCSDYAIYICGREGISFARGWEIPFVHHFNSNPKCGLNGSIGHSPSYLTGSSYPTGIALFDRFRNQSFAKDNPNRQFGHIQGGLFGIRRSMVDEIGGFSTDVPHDYTDVEYSYFAESEGWELGEVPGVLALFNKSRPSLSQRFDDNVVVAHPVLMGEVNTFRDIRAGRLCHCNICNWFGPSFEAADACPTCDSSREDRSLYRWLGESPFMYRRLPALAVGLSGVLNRVWSEQFQGPRLTVDSFVEELKTRGRLVNRDGAFQIAILRPDGLSAADVDLIVSELDRVMGEQAPVLFQPALSEVDAAAVKAVHTSFERFRFRAVAQHRYASRAVRFAYQPLIQFQADVAPEQMAINTLPSVRP